MIINPYIFGGFDPDAQAFITAASITNTTQQNAINTLVVDLKGYGVWTKMKAIYPFVGGTATTHKWNLKDPRDLDAAFRLVFNGGWTHSSTGALPNGTNAYAETKFVPSVQMSANSASLGYYSRTASTSTLDNYVLGATQGVGFWGFVLRDNIKLIALTNTSTLFEDAQYTTGTTNGYFIGSQNASDIILYRNGINLGQNSATRAGSIINRQLYLAASNVGISTVPFTDYPAVFYTTAQTAFVHISDYLTPTEASNLYTAVQAYQTTLGRSVGPQTVSDPDAQAFVTAADIQDQVQAQAINTLTIDLKNYGVWSKMKAIYPFVGGTASSHKFNLKDPRDLDAAFRLLFVGGWTHSSTGALPNGTNGVADTILNDSTDLSLNNKHLSVYLRTNSNGLFFDAGVFNNTNSGTHTLIRNSDNLSFRINDGDGAVASNLDSRGFFVGTRLSSTQKTIQKNFTQYLINSNTVSNLNAKYYLGALSVNNVANFYSNRQLAFSSIGDGLSNTEASNLYIAVQNYQVALSRNV